MEEGESGEDAVMINPLDLTTKVLQAVSRDSGFTTEELLSYSRQPNLMRARHVAVASLHELGLSYPECAKRMNREGHHSVWNSVMVVGKDEGMKKDMERIVEEVRNGREEEE